MVRPRLETVGLRLAVIVNSAWAFSTICNVIGEICWLTPGSAGTRAPFVLRWYCSLILLCMPLYDRMNPNFGDLPRWTRIESGPGYSYGSEAVRSMLQLSSISRVSAAISARNFSHNGLASLDSLSCSWRYEFSLSEVCASRCRASSIPLLIQSFHTFPLAVLYRLYLFMNCTTKEKADKISPSIFNLNPSKGIPLVREISEKVTTN